MTKQQSRFRSASATLAIAACLAAGVADRASAACVPSATVGVNFDCSGVSSNAVSVVNRGPNPSITGDNGNTAFNLAAGSTFTNSGAISVGFDAATLGSNTALPGYYRTRLYGVSGNAAGEYTVVNTASGSILVTNPGLGRLWGVAGNGDATGIKLDNAGTISVVRGPIALGVVQSSSLTARTGALANAALDVAAGVYSEEELETQSIVNGGTIRASGQLAAAIYTRAGEVSLVNSGLIETTTPTTGFAVGAVADSGETRSIEIANSGTIRGDVVLVNGQAQRWWALSNGFGTGGQGVDNRLAINSQYGQFDSEIVNSGTIAGNIFLSNGAHELTNTASGRLAGNIDVDQRETVVTGLTCTIGAAGCFSGSAVVGSAIVGSPAAEEQNLNSSSVITARSGNAATYTLTTWGDKQFEFENAGAMTGNLTVRTEAAHRVNGFAAPGSTVTLEPVISTSGAGSSFQRPASGPGTIAGMLKIWDGTQSTIAATTTVAPEIVRLVHTGEWFTVATDLFGTALPKTASESPLVAWTAGRNAAGALVVSPTVANAASIRGMDPNGASAINALMANPGTDETVARLGGIVQSIDEAEDLVEAGEQLGPNVEGADIELGMAAVETFSDALSERVPAFEGEEGDAGEIASRGVWLQPFGVWTREEEYQGRTGGLILGIEGPVGDAASLGVAIAYARGETHDTEAWSLDVDTFAGAIYGSCDLSPVTIRGSAGVALQNFDTERRVTFETEAFSAAGSHDGTQAFARLDADYPIELGFATLSPLASLMVATLWQDGYQENGTGGVGLSVEDQETTSVQSGLGLAAEIPLSAGSYDLSLELEAVWKHEFADTSHDVTASFLGGPNFSVASELSERDSGEFGVGLELALANDLSATASYEMEVESEGISSQQAALKLGFAF